MASSRVFVKGLPPSITEAEFRKHFSAKGREVTDVKLIPQRRIGYVGYKSPDDASQAIKYFNKTYIRMSKIAVEPAKAIADPTLNKPQGQSRHGWNSSATPVRHQDVVVTPADNDRSDNKKRKREEPEVAADPKLQEYLQVIGSAKESVLAEQSGASSLGRVVPQVEAVPPAEESDDEYENIPAKREKLRKINHDSGSPVENTSAVASREQPARDVANGEITTESKQGVEQSADPEPRPADTSATDEDWLRNRTNRLLDLADPDDLDLITPKTVATSTAATTTTSSTAKEGNPSNAIEGEGPVKENALSQDVVMRDTPSTQPGVQEANSTESAVDMVYRTARLFVRNLPYSAKEDDLRELFGTHGTVLEVHMPISKGNTPKGYALIQFETSDDAVQAFQSLDGATFQGRIIHIIPAEAKKELDEFELAKMPLKKQNMIRKKAEAASTAFNWNSLYMNQDAVNESTAKRLGISKSELLDPTSSDGAVKQAIAETSVIQETKAYFAANGVDLDAFKSHKRGDTAILVKNFPYGTSLDELRTLFEESGPVLRVLMPPSGTIAIVQFSQPNHTKSAFGKLAYRRIKDSVLFLEKAPQNLFTIDPPAPASGGSATTKAASGGDRPPTAVVGVSKPNVDDLLSRGDKTEEAEEVETTSLFVRNLNFDTTTSRLAEVFGALDGFVSARVKTKQDPKKPGQTLSMGFGFAEFRSKEQAQAALKVMDGHVLDGHTLAVKASHRGLDAAEERRREDKAKKAAGQRTKIIVKNLPFQATKKDVRALFGTYGQLRSVRVPKKADYSTRGFAFADFVTSREAENALNALKDTHLLGRRLVLDFAEAEAVDAEEEIAKMQKKVGRQVNKVALQKLTGGGRKKVNLGGDEEDGGGEDL